jgi:hypothetical protein
MEISKREYEEKQKRKEFLKEIGAQEDFSDLEE